MKTLYFDCFAGASGDMILGALVSLGVPGERLAEEIRHIGIDGVNVSFVCVDRSGISAVKADVAAPPENKHRHLHHIESMIDHSLLSETVKERSKKIFRRLAEAEAAVHGCAIEKVHFHEVGAVDAIVDVVGACIGFDLLGVERFACSKLNVGSGFVRMSHGLYPIPPPAVANLLKGFPIYSNEVESELMTPTGAAIITTLCESYVPSPEVTVEAIGYGAGTREYDDFPNALRLILGQTVDRTARTFSGSHTEDLITLETNLDDVSPQVIAYVTERILDAGALDCWLTPILMKKGRAGTKISILCTRDLEVSLTELLFAETTTLGVRSIPVKRISVERRVETVSTKFGRISVKVAERDGKTMNVMPEYEDVKRAAMEHGVPLREVQEEALYSFNLSSKSAGSAI